MAGIGWYNGWSPDERQAATPIQKAALAAGTLERPRICSICQCPGNRDWRAEDAVWFHNEDYAAPLKVYALCRRCHRLLHQRFRLLRRQLAQVPVRHRVPLQQLLDLRRQRPKVVAFVLLVERNQPREEDHRRVVGSPVAAGWLGRACHSRPVYGTAPFRSGLRPPRAALSPKLRRRDRFVTFPPEPGDTSRGR